MQVQVQDQVQVLHSVSRSYQKLQGVPRSFQDVHLLHGNVPAGASEGERSVVVGSGLPVDDGLPRHEDKIL